VIHKGEAEIRKTVTTTARLGICKTGFGSKILASSAMNGKLAQGKV
jgi:hypothetical protein